MFYLTSKGTLKFLIVYSRFYLVIFNFVPDWLCWLGREHCKKDFEIIFFHQDNSLKGLFEKNMELAELPRKAKITLYIACPLHFKNRL